MKLIPSDLIPSSSSNHSSSSFSQSSTTLHFNLPDATRSAPDLLSSIQSNHTPPPIHPQHYHHHKHHNQDDEDDEDDDNIDVQEPLLPPQSIIVEPLSSTQSRSLHQRSQSELPPPPPAPTLSSSSSSSLDRQASIRFQRRFQALLEIIETENGYLRDLKRLDGFYLSKLDSLQSLKPHEKQIIRRNLAQVIELAERFTRRISIAIVGHRTHQAHHIPPLVHHRPSFESEPIDHRHPHPHHHHHHLLAIRDEIELDRIIERVARAFISESPIFTIYEEFCAKHTEAADLIRSFESSPEWISSLHQNQSPSSESFIHPNPTQPHQRPDPILHPTSSSSNSPINLINSSSNLIIDPQLNPTCKPLNLSPSTQSNLIITNYSSNIIIPSTRTQSAITYLTPTLLEPILQPNLVQSHHDSTQSTRLYHQTDPENHEVSHVTQRSLDSNG